jgi:hypothetical protein
MTTRGHEVLWIKTHGLSEHACARAHHIAEVRYRASNVVHVASNDLLIRCHILRTPLAPPSFI